MDNIETKDLLTNNAAAAAKRKAEDNLAAGYDVAAHVAAAPPPPKKPRALDSEEEDSKRRVRLESNRKAARESRRRKKVLVEELQRSVIFFTRANAQLKQKNEGLEAMLYAARGQLEGGGVSAALAGLQDPNSSLKNEEEELKPSAVAPQAAPVAPPAPQVLYPTVAAIPQHPPQATQPMVPSHVGAPLGVPESPMMQQLHQLQQAQAQAAANAQASNGNSALLAANWLAVAQQAAQVQQMGAVAPVGVGAATAGLVPNPMLQIPGMNVPSAAGWGFAANPLVGNLNAMAANPLLGMTGMGGVANPFGAAFGGPMAQGPADVPQYAAAAPSTLEGAGAPTII